MIVFACPIEKVTLWKGLLGTVPRFSGMVVKLIPMKAGIREADSIQ